MRSERSYNPTALEDMFAQLRDIILDGARHGHFDLTVTGEIVNGGTRRVIVKAGKSHVFFLSAHELHR